jgi:beta-N-acetylhexosaminidase
MDHNGHPVPDGTVVRFTVSLGGEGGVFQQQDATTIAGSAGISFRIDKPGLVEIRAASEPAIISEVLQLDVKEGAPAVVTVVVPFPSETPVPSTPTPVQVPQSDFVTPEGAPRFGGWLFILFVLGGGAALALWVGRSLGSPRWSIRWALCALLGGLLVYNYLALGLPGASEALQAGGGGVLIGFTILGEAAGVLAAWLWRRNKP